MMQVTRAAFQAVASLNEQATDPKSHTPVKNVYTSCSLVPLPANSDGRPFSALRRMGRMMESFPDWIFRQMLLALAFSIPPGNWTLVSLNLILRRLFRS
jgi:hypothetical protein